MNRQRKRPPPNIDDIYLKEYNEISYEVIKSDRYVIIDRLKYDVTYHKNTTLIFTICRDKNINIYEYEISDDDSGTIKHRLISENKCFINNLKGDPTCIKYYEENKKNMIYIGDDQGNISKLEIKRKDGEWVDENVDIEYLGGYDNILDIIVHGEITYILSSTGIYYKNASNMKNYRKRKFAENIVGKCMCIFNDNIYVGTNKNTLVYGISNLKSLTPLDINGIGDFSIQKSIQIQGNKRIQKDKMYFCTDEQIGYIDKDHDKKYISINESINGIEKIESYEDDFFLIANGNLYLLSTNDDNDVYELERREGYNPHKFLTTDEEKEMGYTKCKINSICVSNITGSISLLDKDKNTSILGIAVHKEMNRFSFKYNPN